MVRLRLRLRLRLALRLRLRLSVTLRLRLRLRVLGARLGALHRFELAGARLELLRHHGEGGGGPRRRGAGAEGRSPTDPGARGTGHHRSHATRSGELARQRHATDVTAADVTAEQPHAGRQRGEAAQIAHSQWRPFRKRSGAALHTLTLHGLADARARADALHGGPDENRGTKAPTQTAKKKEEESRISAVLWPIAC